MRALIFDLDGTLVDTVYPHVVAWQQALEEAGMTIDGWRIHRRIGMSGGLFTRAVSREVGRPLSPAQAEALQKRHGEIFRTLAQTRRALPGAVQLLERLRELNVPHAIATSGRHPEIDASLEALSVPAGTHLVHRGDVAPAKPAPGLFVTAAVRLSIPAEQCYVVGDAVWDLLAARRARMFSVGLLTGGDGSGQPLPAGASRRYPDPAAPPASPGELGLPP